MQRLFIRHTTSESITVQPASSVRAVLPRLLGMLCIGCSVLASPLLLAAKPAVIYAGRERPQPPKEENYPYYRILNQSSGYGYPGYGRPQANVNINMRYQAPSTTIINNNVQVIPPSAPVGSISYSQDNYYINTAPVYPDYNNRPHRHRHYVNNQSEQGDDPPRVIERSPWTQDIGSAPP